VRVGGRNIFDTIFSSWCINLEQSDQQLLFKEVLPEVLPKVCTDDACLGIIRAFINEESSRAYREEHMGGL
jgi:hypothetical protein